ncbi:hypothetical protein ACU686_26110 [Yinghuangia aomiensis]
MTDADQVARGEAVAAAYLQREVDRARAERDAAQAKLDAAEADAAAFAASGKLPADELNPRLGDGIMLVQVDLRPRHPKRRRRPGRLPPSQRRPRRRPGMDDRPRLRHP